MPQIENNPGGISLRTSKEAFTWLLWLLVRSRMLRYLLVVIVVIVVAGGQWLTAQAHYRPAYLIDETGTRREVSILDRDWADNPRRFRYLSGAERREGTLANVREFGYADGSLRYLRSVVLIDQTSDRVNDLSTSEQSEYQRDTVFLEWLVDGEADLFYWEAGDVRRFFFRQGEGDPQPLINRRYRNRQLIVRQELYRGQLRSSVNCGTTDETLRRLMYPRTAFVQYFEAYNDCREVNYRVSFRDRSARPFRFAFRPGVEFYVGHTASTSALGIESRASLPPTAAWRMGLEVEYVIPLRNERWRLFSEVYYHHVRGEELEEGSRNVTINLRSVNLPLGVRRYVPLPGEWTAFLTAGGVLQFPWKSTVGRWVGYNYRSYEASWNFGALGGVGVEFRKRFQLEARYQHDQDVLQTYIDQSTFF